ncbi:LysR substrate-binding domain-containing protein [Methylobacterium sp.]|uniref:LysR substrate-binding domain-containing protein n=1 Tax=Methylobacterium sp. TaxID=409 RepID=UPI003B00D17A
MTRRIPPLNPLHVFEVAARVNGFSRAANELNVTQSAVSRQIAVLENYLGVRLFHRERHGASLTEAGAAYAAEIREPFVRIAAATARLLDQKATETLHVRAYATFAAKWLIPRLADFHTRYPRVRIQLSNTVRPIDFSRETIDVGIQLGQGDWPGTQSRLLLPDLIQPVCSPDLARTIGEDLSALRSRPLLHSHYRRRDWGDWLAARGLPEEWGPAGMMFESSVLTYQAAAEGLGIAMGQVALLREDIAAGRLVPLFGPPLARDLGHHAVWPVGRPMNRKLEIFLAWLQAQASDPDAVRKGAPVRA